MTTFIDIKRNTSAITFHEVVLVVGSILAIVPFFFTVNLNTYQHKTNGRKFSKCSSKKIPPSFTDVPALKPQDKTW